MRRGRAREGGNAVGNVREIGDREKAAARFDQRKKVRDDWGGTRRSWRKCNYTV